MDPGDTGKGISPGLVILDRNGSEINGRTLELKGGEMSFLTALYNGKRTGETEWKSDSKLVTVKNGMITAKEVAKETAAVISTTVKVTDPDSGIIRGVVSQRVRVIVKPVEVEDPVSNDKSHNLKIKRLLKLTSSKEKAELKVSVSPKEEDDISRVRIVDLRSSNENVVSIDRVSGITVKGKKGEASALLSVKSPGTAYITVKTSSGVSGFNTRICRVTVKSPAKDLTVKSGSLSVSEDRIIMKKGGSGTVDVSLFPEFSTDLDKLKISGKGGITVKNGVIYARKAAGGSRPATLTVKCGRVKKTVRVEVY